MDRLAPVAKSRLAFAALIFSLFLVVAGRTVETGDPRLLFYLLSLLLSVFAVGHCPVKESFIRAAIATGVLVLAALIANLASGRGLPDYGQVSVLVTSLTGLFAFNLVLLVGASALVVRVWPESDHWTR